MMSSNTMLADTGTDSTTLGSTPPSEHAKLMTTDQHMSGNKRWVRN